MSTRRPPPPRRTDSRGSGASGWCGRRCPAARPRRSGRASPAPRRTNSRQSSASSGSRSAARRAVRTRRTAPSGAGAAGPSSIRKATSTRSSFGVVPDVVVHLGVQVAVPGVDVPQPDHVALKLERAEGVLAHRADERQEAERPAETHHSAPGGERDPGPEVLLLQGVLAGEAELDLAHLGARADAAQGILRRRGAAPREQEQRSSTRPSRVALRTHSAPASSMPAGRLPPAQRSPEPAAAGCTPARSPDRWRRRPAARRWPRCGAAAAD